MICLHRSCFCNLPIALRGNPSRNTTRTGCLNFIELREALVEQGEDALLFTVRWRAEEDLPNSRVAAPAGAGEWGQTHQG